VNLWIYISITKVMFIKEMIYAKRFFLHHAQVIIAVEPQISHVDFNWFLKQYSIGVSNSSGLFSTYPLLYHAYRNKFLNLGDENWPWVNDCNFKILFLAWRFISRSKSITISKKCLMKFFHKWKPYTSNGCMFPVVPAGIINRIIVSVEL